MSPVDPIITRLAVALAVGVLLGGLALGERRYALELLPGLVLMVLAA